MDEQIPLIAPTVRAKFCARCHRRIKEVHHSGGRCYGGGCIRKVGGSPPARVPAPTFDFAPKQTVDHVAIDGDVARLLDALRGEVSRGEFIAAMVRLEAEIRREQ